MSKIEFEINYHKALEAVLYVLTKRQSVNLYNILKIIFEADKVHLNQHGRPVTGDLYFKMRHGTVPSFVYDMFKGDPMGLAALDIEEYPFVRHGYQITATRAPNLDYLSESDLECLEQGIQKYLLLSFRDVEKLNHLEKCWKESEIDRPIDFELIIENEKIKKDLAETPFKLVV